MATMTIAIPEDALHKLQEKAARLGLSTDDLVRASIDALLSQPDDDFQVAADYVLKKNADLYKRLADANR